MDFHPLFSAQTRIESAEFGNIGQLEEFLAKEAKTGTEGRSSPSPQVDGILISHPFTDHMHKEVSFSREESSRTHHKGELLTSTLFSSRPYSILPYA